MEILKNFTPRLYQEKIFAKCLKQNTLVVLPTGLGKTAISIMLSAAMLKTQPESKIIILAPTRPLVDQHFESFKKTFSSDFLHEDDFIVLNGTIKPEVRKTLFEESKIIFSTPQGLENDILCRRINLSNVSLIVFDEAHRATGDYSYVWIANQYHKQAKKERILALTASPGTDKEVIDLVTKNLFIEEIEFKDRNSEDVKPYIKETKIDWIEINLPIDYLEILNSLKELMKNKIKQIEQILGKFKKPNMSKKDLLEIQAQLQGLIARGESSTETYSAVSICAQIMKIQHGIELLETQGTKPAVKYMDEIWKQGNSKKTKAATNLVQDPLFKKALTKLWKLSEDKIIHPKIPKLIEILKETLSNNSDAKIIIFNNYRESIKDLHKIIKEQIPEKDSKNKNLARPAIFVGQSKKNGIGNSQKEQLNLIKEFKENIHNIMLMSSVGEEGLDIPAVDLVIFYEPVPSAIRQIQRAGRTGRQEKGKVIILMAKGTRDVAYKWSTDNKQKKMYEILHNSKQNMLENIENKQEVIKETETIKETKTEYSDKNETIKKGKSENENQKTLTENFKAKFILESKEEFEIIVDSREKCNRIIKTLMDKDIKITLNKLEVGDYILTKNVAVEFKTKKDFVDSIIDGRLFDQAKKMTHYYSKPIIVVQGEENIYGLRNINPEAISGVIATISTTYRIPIIFTQNEQETINIFLSIIKKQTEKPKLIQQHNFKPKEDFQMQEYIVSSFANIGTNQAKKILKDFKSIKNFINSNLETLKSIEGIGETKANKIIEIINKEYNKD